MTIAEHFQKYTNALGFVSNEPNGSTGNDLLFSGEACVIRRKLGVWTQGDHTALLDSIKQHAEIEPGLYGRPGWRQDQEGLDDYIGLVCIDLGLAEMILEYGQKHWWYFKTVENCPWYEPIFLRFPALIAHIYWSAGKKPPVFFRLAWCLSVAFSGTKTEQDAYILNWLLIEKCENGGFFEGLASWLYWRKLKKNYPGGLQQVFARYFGNPSHPIAAYVNQAVGWTE